MINNQALKRLDNAFTNHGDGHCHIFDLTQSINAQRRYNPKASALKEQLVAVLKRHHISSALLSQPSFLGTNNSQIIEAIRWAQNHDFIFKGVAAIEPTMPFEHMQKLKSQGIIGIRLNLIGEQDLALYTNQNWQRVYKNLAKLGWHLEVYCHSEKIAPVLPIWLEHCPIVVFDHFALPSVDETSGGKNFQKLLKMTDGQVMVKITGTYRFYPQLSIKQANQKARIFYDLLLQNLGQNQLIWGSDWPWTQFENHLDFTDCLNWCYWYK